jgi:hypothetical protein
LVLDRVRVRGEGGEGDVVVAEGLGGGGQEVPFECDGVGEVRFGGRDGEDGFVRGAHGARVEEDLVAFCGRG